LLLTWTLLGKLISRLIGPYTLRSCWSLFNDWLPVYVRICIVSYFFYLRTITIARHLEQLGAF